MVNYLRYDLDSEMQLSAEIPTIAYDRAMKETRLAEIIESENPFVTVNPERSGVHFTFNKASFKRLRTDDIEAGASRWLYAINSTRKFTPNDLIDPDLDAHMMQVSSGDMSGQGRLGFNAELAWPLRNYEQAQEMATRAMRETALTFGYLQKSIIDSAYASADHEHGVSLQALDIGCCCVATDGNFFDPKEIRAELYGHNLYNRQVMLTCFSGLVALARAR